MKASRHLSVMWVTAVFLCAVVSSTAAESPYMITDLDDPLQPVWNALDRLPGDVSEAVISAIRTEFSKTNTQLEDKVRPLTTRMASVASSLDRLEQRVSSGRITSTQGTSNTNNGQSSTRVLSAIREAVAKLERHINTQMEELETKLKTHIDAKLSGSPDACPTLDPGVEDEQGVINLAQTMQQNHRALQNITTHVLKIDEKLGRSEEGGESCSTLVNKVSELMIGNRECAAKGKPSMLRDCSDKHWQELGGGDSGVHETFPTHDIKAPVSAYCDMGDPGDKLTGGWTVILRRQKVTSGQVNFNRTWAEYRTGFGDVGATEWWYGLANLHALTYRQTYEVDLLLHDITRGVYHVQYKTFRVEDEANNFKLLLNGFSGNISNDALTPHHGVEFTTYDRDNDAWTDGNCAQSNGGGWWFDECHYATLTAPFPTPTTKRTDRTIRWMDHEGDWLVFDDVTMKIRPSNYADRYNPLPAA